METILNWLPLIALAINLGVLWLAWSMRQVAAKQMHATAGQIHERLNSHAERLTRAEAQLADAPTAKALHELALAVNTFSGELKAVVARLDGMGEIVKRLETITARQEEYIHELSRRGGSVL